ncbi:MAG: hypothetical protein NTY12_01400 [Candidatus Falkowbacteria bacterium]|nr:hypothetical protein [Candidatus Falkowbacteria bacterium]
MIKQNEQVDERLRKYRDTGGLTTNQLDFGLWYIRNRKKFFIALVVVLIITAAGTIGYSLYQFSSYLFVGAGQDKQTFIDLTSSTSLVTNKMNLGSNVSYSDVRVLPTQNNNSDLVAAVTNANPRLAVNISYYFDVNGQRIGATNDFVLPGDTKYLMALNQSISSNSSASLVVEHLSFVRLDRHSISDWDQYRLEHFNFLIQNAKFTTSVESGLSEKISLGQLDFKITNNSAYGYITVPLTIVLKSQGQIVAVNRYMINNFKSGEEKSVQISWPGRLPSVNEVEILPDLNIIDDSIYLKYSTL